MKTWKRQVPPHVREDCRVSIREGTSKIAFEYPKKKTKHVEMISPGIRDPKNDKKKTYSRWKKRDVHLLSTAPSTRSRRLWYCHALRSHTSHTTKDRKKQNKKQSGYEKVHICEEKWMICMQIGSVSAFQVHRESR